KSNRLATGKFDTYTVRSLLRFDVADVPKEIDVNTITSVEIKVAYYRVDGQINDKPYCQGDMTMELRLLDRHFDEDRATWYRATKQENWVNPGGDFGPVVARLVLGPPEYRRDFVKMDVTDPFFDWVENPQSNHGVIFTESIANPDDAIKEFYSLDEYSKEDAPRLVITYIDEDDEDDEEGGKRYKEIVPEKDCFITLNEAKFSGDLVHGGDQYLDYGSFYGYARRTLIRFDLDEKKTGIPEDAVILKARMRLYHKPVGRDERIDLVGNRLLESFGEYDRQDELEDTKFHDNYDYIAKEFVHEDPGYADFYINGLVQEWVIGKYPNFGMVIRPKDESIPNFFPRFAAAQNDDPARTPHMEVWFTVPGRPWYIPEPGGSAGVEMVKR
ncbi:MAG: DNRLRE domain-containing protein, partial [bacterium]|nr:DNRLRE domain-containing protein [bacterium]